MTDECVNWSVFRCVFTGVSFCCLDSCSLQIKLSLSICTYVHLQTVRHKPSVYSKGGGAFIPNTMCVSSLLHPLWHLFGRQQLQPLSSTAEALTHIIFLPSAPNVTSPSTLTYFRRPTVSGRKQPSQGAVYWRLNTTFLYTVKFNYLTAAHCRSWRREAGNVLRALTACGTRGLMGVLAPGTWTDLSKVLSEKHRGQLLLDNK